MFFLLFRSVSPPSYLRTVAGQRCVFFKQSFKNTKHVVDLDYIWIIFIY